MRRGTKADWVASLVVVTLIIFAAGTARAALDRHVRPEVPWGSRTPHSHLGARDVFMGGVGVGPRLGFGQA